MAELKIFQRDTVLIRGRKKREALGTALGKECFPQNCIKLSQNISKNLRARSGDIIEIKVVTNIPNIIKLHLLPIENQNSSLAPQQFLPYLKSRQIPVKMGDILHLQKDSFTIQLKIILTFPCKQGIITKNTQILYKEYQLKKQQEVNNIRFSDIAGHQAEINIVRDLIQINKFPVFLHFKRNILIYGISGCGKTLILQAIANQTNDLFFYFDIENFIAEKQKQNILQRIFSSITSSKTKLLFIDNIDKITSLLEDGEGRRTYFLFLTFLRKLQQKSRLITIATASQFHPALKHLKVFRKQIFLRIPNHNDRKKILQSKMKKWNLEESFNLDNIAENTHGFVGSQLAFLCSEVFLSIYGEKAIYQFDKASENIIQKQKISQNDFNLVLKKTKMSNQNLKQPQIPNRKWENIGGYENLKNQCEKIIFSFLSNSNKFKQIHIKKPKGLLFYGPERCGKTQLAEAIAGKYGISLMTVRKGDFFSSICIETSIRKIFEKARMAKPCIILFDEIAEVVLSRSQRYSLKSECIINKLSDELDKIQENEKILCIITTKSPQIINEALLKYGKFDHFIYVPYPDQISREEISKVHLKNLPLQNTIDLRFISQITDGFSGGQIVDKCRKAQRIAFLSYLQALQRMQVLIDNYLLTEQFDPVPLITRRDFQMALRRRGCYTSMDLEKYEQFKRRHCLDLTKKKPAILKRVYEQEQDLYS